MWQGSLKDKPGGVPFPVPTGKLNTRKSAMSETGWRKPVSDIAFDPEKSKRTMRYAAEERALNLSLIHISRERSKIDVNGAFSGVEIAPLE